MSSNSANAKAFLQDLESFFQAREFEKLLEMCHDVLTHNTELTEKDTLFVLNMQHKALRESERFEEALSVADTQLAFLMEHFPDSIVYKAQIKQNKALIYTRLEIYPKAISNALQSIEILEKNPEHAGYLAGALSIASSAYYNADDLGNAEKMLLQALAIWQKESLELRSEEEPRHFQASTCYNNLGRIYERLEKYDKAILYHTKAVNLRKELLGEHPETAFCMGNLGTAYASMGEWHKAAMFLQEAVDTYATLGMETFVLAQGYQANLAIAREALNNDPA